MGVLITPPLDDKPWPTLGPQVCDFLTERAVFGPGSLKGQPARLDVETRAAIYRAYEVFPRRHAFAGRRRFQRVGLSFRKGVAKTEKAAWVAYAELHPEGPVRFDGWDARGQPVGRPVADPYIPMIGFTEEQSEELAYGALIVVCSEGPDADLFDIGLDRILRLDHRGRADGKAAALAAAPNARDGARTTFQMADETHRLYLPRLVAGWETMLGNLPKRPMEDPWALEVTTAGQLGQGSIAEATHREAEAIARGEIEEPALFYFHREAGGHHDLSTLDGRVEAIAEATGPVGEFGPNQFRSIAKQWDRPGADKAYLERVWLNRWVRAEAQAFDPRKFESLRRDDVIAPGELVTFGFDGARFQDSTAIVLTDVVTGLQQLWAIWERPLDLPDGGEWEVPEDEVTDAVAEAMKRFQVWAGWCDPPHWTETVASWAARYPDKIKEWWTNRKVPMAHVIRGYREAMDAGEVTYASGPLSDVLARHFAAAGRRDVNVWTDDRVQLFILGKLHPDRKLDASMAALLSWAARIEALKVGAKKRNRAAPSRIR